MGTIINKETFNEKLSSVPEKYVNPGLESKRSQHSGVQAGGGVPTLVAS